MLSGMGAGGQEQNGRAADPVSSWECSKVILRRGDRWVRRSHLYEERKGGPATSKKTLIFPQNLENKEPGFFPPRRSMVLKVVRGKILETLELSWFQGSFSNTPETAPEPCGVSDRQRPIIYMIICTCLYYHS